jgi:hypothetical protein
MKKLFGILISLLLVTCYVWGQSTISYTLPLDLSGNQVVDPVQDISEITAATSYSVMISTISKLQADLGMQTDNLNKNKNLDQVYTPLGSALENTTNYPDAKKLADLVTAYTTAMKTVKANIDISKKNLVKINTNIEKINGVINNRMNVEQSQQTFRQWVSLVFAGLLAIIIGCFFFVLFKNNSAQMATTLMGESGLQFITLFSLIIAIILFGVLNILEGKELAAIISAIAGFILGKYNPGKDTNAGGVGGPPPPVPPPAS